MKSKRFGFPAQRLHWDTDIYQIYKSRDNQLSMIKLLRITGIIQGEKDDIWEFKDGMFCF